MHPSGSRARKAILASLVLLGCADLAALNFAAGPAWVKARASAELPPEAPPSARVATRPPQPPDRSEAPEAGRIAATAAAAPTPAPGAPAEMPRGSRPSATMVRFPTASAAVDQGAALILLGVAQRMREDPSLRVVLRGFADERGTREFNQWLSLRRAEAVAEFCQRAGIAADRITSTGQGAAQPLDGTGTPEALARNRRVEIVWR
jgi:outer membrane protein OmpA-like peptidoglycan-associated protein